MLRRCSILLLLFLPALAGCGGVLPAVASAAVGAAPSPTARPALPPTATAAPPTAESFVGRVADSDAFVALIADDARVTAYVCDGATLAAWFTGARQGDTIALADAEGRRLAATFTPATAGRPATLSRGGLHTPDGAERGFTTQRATDLARAGLYRAATPEPGGDAKASVGVIVLGDGDFRGAYYADETVTPVTEARLGAGSLTAVVPGHGSFEAARLTAPGTWGARPASAALVAYRHRAGMLPA